MTGKDRKLNAFDVKLLDSISAAAQNMLEVQRRQREAEAARVASLTPAQRVAEKRAYDVRLAEAERQKLVSKLAKFGDAIRKHETWTIDRFCWLLAAEDPDDSETWGFFDSRSGKAEGQHRQFKAVLDSCVRAPLRPVNPNDSPTAWRFTVTSLMEIAQAKRLGYFDILAEMISQKKENRRATPIKSLSEQGTQSREQQPVKRRRELVEMARAIAEAGEGIIDPTCIALNINGIELNARFKQKYPRWRKISDKTLEADRPACSPRIVVATGRPPNKAEKPL